MHWASLTVLTEGCGHLPRERPEAIQNSSGHQVGLFWAAQQALIGILAIESKEYSYSLKSTDVNICMLTYMLRHLNPTLNLNLVVTPR